MIHRKLLIIIAIIIVCSFSSCKKFIEIEAPKNSLVPSRVFKNDGLATSAVLGMYQQMALSGYASGDYQSISTLCGLTADEYIGYSSLVPYYQNKLLSTDGLIGGLWGDLYKRVYDANSILEGLSSSESIITAPVKMQLEGEALFVRAFSYFYLVNLYGPVPLYLTSNYKLNSTFSRTPTDKIYEQILIDLKASELKLTDSYVTAERVRPNKATVQALLARTYFYMGDWQNAEKYASLVIGKTATYSLVALDNIFLKNSQETIWSLVPAANTNTPSGNLLILSAAPAFVSLRSDFVQNVFEQNDLRKTSWIKSLSVSGVTYYYPFKYKIRSSNIVSEYTMVFRLAEQFLIRAEARARQNNLPGSIEDLDAIRGRAGLSLIRDINPEINQADLINSIQKERFPELFSEWGDRWFDLKRTGKAQTILGPIKPNWKTTSILFPIPISEITANSKIVQNEGY